MAIDVVTDVISTAAPVWFAMVPLVSTVQRSSSCERAENVALHSTRPDGHGTGAVVVVGAAVVVGEVVAVVDDVGRSGRVVVVVLALVVVVVPPSATVVDVEAWGSPVVGVAVVLERGTVEDVGASSVVVERGTAVGINAAGAPALPPIPAATSATPAATSSARGRPKAIMTGSYVPRPARP